jgi:hypothetical protein
MHEGDLMFGSKNKGTGHGIVALFTASDDTVDMIQRTAES